MRATAQRQPQQVHTSRRTAPLRPPAHHPAARRVRMPASPPAADVVASATRRAHVMASSLAPPAAAAPATSAFASVPPAPPDAILGLNAAFHADGSPDKVNLGVGAYRTADNKPYVLPVVRRVEAALAADAATTHEYLPQYGLERFTVLAARLLLGEDCPATAAGRVVTVQALSGTGAVRVAFEFVKRFGEAGASTKVLLPNPTWSNHKNIVADAGLRLGEYRYFDSETGGVDIEGMCEDLRAAPPGSVALLHACAHNRTFNLRVSS